MSELVYFTTLAVFFGTILAVFAMRYVAQVRQARARILTEDAYRAISEKAVAAQTESAAALAAIQSDLSAIGARVTAVEKILKEVE